MRRAPRPRPRPRPAAPRRRRAHGGRDFQSSAARTGRRRRRWTATLGGAVRRTSAQIVAVVYVGRTCRALHDRRPAGRRHGRTARPPASVMWPLMLTGRVCNRRWVEPCSCHRRMCCVTWSPPVPPCPPRFARGMPPGAASGRRRSVDPRQAAAAAARSSRRHVRHWIIIVGPRRKGAATACRRRRRRRAEEPWVREKVYSPPALCLYAPAFFAARALFRRRFATQRSVSH